MQLREIKFETMKKSYKKQIIIGAFIICLVGGILTFRTTRAKYKLTENIKIASGIVNYIVPDLRTIVKISDDGINYEYADNIPTSGYSLNTTRSACKIYDGTKEPEESTIDTNITIEYVNGKINIKGANKKNTRCYLYFSK